jgi:ATP-dependent DNA ligase
MNRTKHIGARRIGLNFSVNLSDAMSFLFRTKLVAQIEFTEWTPDSHLRHSKFVGLKELKAWKVVQEG